MGTNHSSSMGNDFQRSMRGATPWSLIAFVASIMLPIFGTLITFFKCPSIVIGKVCTYTEHNTIYKMLTDWLLCCCWEGTNKTIMTRLFFLLENDVRNFFEVKIVNFQPGKMFFSKSHTHSAALRSAPPLFFSTNDPKMKHYGLGQKLNWLWRLWQCNIY